MAHFQLPISIFPSLYFFLLPLVRFFWVFLIASERDAGTETCAWGKGGS